MSQLDKSDLTRKDKSCVMAQYSSGNNVSALFVVFLRKNLSVAENSCTSQTRTVFAEEGDIVFIQLCK